METGYVKLHRSIDKWEWSKKPFTFRVFVYCLTHARHTPGQYQGVQLQPGQFITGRDAISRDTGITTQSVRTALKNLEKTGEITIKPTNKFSVVTVVNWAKFQTPTGTPNQQINQQLTNNQPATNQQLTTNKNDNNVRMKDDVVGTISPTLLEAIQGANRAWEQPAKSILTSFQSLAEEYGEAALIEAIKTAVEYDTQGGVSVAYVKAILKGSGQEPPAEAPTPFDPQKAYGTLDDDIDIRRS